MTVDLPRPHSTTPHGRGPSFGGEVRSLAAEIRALAGPAAATGQVRDARRPGLTRRLLGRLAGAARRRMAGLRRAGRDPAKDAGTGRADATPDLPELPPELRPGGDGPLVSVVIPTFDRRRELARALDAWQRQTPRALRFELVVVDDGSGDGTPELLSGWRSDRYDLEHRRQPNRGPAAARNLALEAARAPLVLFTGDDIEPTPTLLAEHLRGHAAAADPGLAVVGRIAWPPGADTTATMRHVDGRGAQQFGFHWMEDGREYDFRHFYTSNVSVRRSLLDRAEGGFSTDFAAAAFEDAELAYRLVPHGLRIVYRAAALAYHHHRYDAAGFYRRQVRCGRMGVVLVRRFPEVADAIGLAEVDRLGRSVAGADRDRRSGLAAVAAELDRLEARLLAVATACDGLPDPISEPVLWAAFRTGFVRGAADASMPEGRAREVTAAVLVEHVLPALDRLADAAAGGRIGDA